MARILLIDDSEDLSHLLQIGLEERGHVVECLGRADGALDAIRDGAFDVVLLDNRMPGISGIDLLADLRRHGLDVSVILMTGYATSDTAIQAMNLGAFDYVVKPLDTDELLGELGPIIGEALRQRRQAPVVDGADHGADLTTTVLRGTSKPMVEVSKLIGRFARSADAVLVLGETGTGKDLVARAIHNNSPRKNKPFVALNCTALNENLLDDELFGHEPGAFTNAVKLRKGRFEHADGGTLFLDEVGDMPLPLQAKLLRVLENREVSRVGSNEVIKVDVRLVSATHRDLEAAIREGRFRQDLYFRLKGLRICLPPLRDRGDDLELLARHFVARASHDAGLATPRLAEATLASLRRYPWPGNIRELRNVMYTAVGMCRGPQILPEHLDISPAEARQSGESEATAGLRQAVRWALATGRDQLLPVLQEMLERELLWAALAADGNKTQVSKRLGMSRNTVIKLCKKYGFGDDGALTS